MQEKADDHLDVRFLQDQDVFAGKAVHIVDFDADGRFVHLEIELAGVDDFDVRRRDFDRLPEQLRDGSRGGTKADVQDFPDRVGFHAGKELV